MSSADTPVFSFVSVDYAGAATATGLSEASVRAAVDAGELPTHYGGPGRTKPLILARDLWEWIEDLPTTKRGNRQVA